MRSHSVAAFAPTATSSIAGRLASTISLAESDGGGGGARQDEAALTAAGMFSIESYTSQGTAEQSWPARDPSKPPPSAAVSAAAAAVIGGASPRGGGGVGGGGGVVLGGRISEGNGDAFFADADAEVAAVSARSPAGAVAS